ncbi:MAG: histidine kinase [Treponema sp.]|jgi:two-component system sensor histidine kinase ChvG|nr:histidine kinase [Treponema sp.]
MKSLSVRLLLFNILLLFLPLGSLLYLDTYENQLLASQENSMIQQGRLLSSALSGRDFSGAELAAEALRILVNLGGRVDSRLRVVDTRGNLVADSAVISAGSPVENSVQYQPGQDEDEPAVPAETEGSAEAGAEMQTAADETRKDASPNDSFLYRMAVYPVNVFKRLFFPPGIQFTAGEFYSGQKMLLGPEIRAALEGRYGAATRYSSGGQVSLNLYSAIPVWGGDPGKITGAVLVSRSSYGILLNLYRIRLDIIRIFFVSLLVSLVLSLGLSFTITIPIKKLKEQAEGMLDKSGHFRSRFRGLRRKDEIGDLSRSLSALSLKLEKRISFIDTFTADLLHELKNPLAAIRGLVELSLSSPVREEQLLSRIAREENRMERLLARLRELSGIDNSLEQEASEFVDLAQFIPLLLEPYRNQNLAPDASGVSIVFKNECTDEQAPAEKVLVLINPDRLGQALLNPLDNALSFAPPASQVTLTLSRGEAGGIKGWLITVDDQGPGIREESGGRYFERFYSERPQEEKQDHSGIGLAIVRAIVQGYGGYCSLTNRHPEPSCSGGCRFLLVLPAVPAGSARN